MQKTYQFKTYCKDDVDDISPLKQQISFGEPWIGVCIGRPYKLQVLHILLFVVKDAIAQSEFSVAPPSNFIQMDE